jgi:predicted nuclease of predicted toxin-antitoxin system
VHARALEEERVIISTDMDFAYLHAQKELSLPSVILSRRAERKTDARLGLILKNLVATGADLERGSVAIFESSRIRIRRLPIGKKD